MKETLNLDFCDITFYDSYFIIVMKEGVNITDKHNEVLANISKTYYADRSFVYISIRVNSYSVDPKIYHKIGKIDNLMGFAVVSDNYRIKENIKIEQLFFNKPIKLFETKDEAIEWANSIIKN